MRTIFFLLLLANAILFAYAQLDSAGTGEGARLTQQVRPDTIKLLTPQQVAALGPGKVAELADVCIEWGPFSDGQRARVMSEIEPLGLGRLLTQKRVETNTAYWVYLPRFPNKAAAEKRVALLTSAGFKDLSVIDSGPQRFALSLGVFRSEEAANAFLEQVHQNGVADARVGPREQTLTQILLVIRDPEAAVVARLKGLQLAYPETEARVGSCDKTG
jgi:SPOR domain